MASSDPRNFSANFKPVDIRKSGGAVHWRGRLGGSWKGSPLAHGPQLGMNDGLVFQTNPVQIGPNLLLDIRVGGTFERTFEIRMLAPYLFPKAGFQQRDAMLKGALLLGNASQESNFVARQPFFPFHAPMGPMRPDVVQLLRNVNIGCRSAPTTQPRYGCTRSAPREWLVRRPSPRD